METKNHEASVAGKVKTVAIDRTFNLPVDNMWKAWSEPESFKKWWGPEEFTCPTAKIDFKVGGVILACMKGEDGKEYWSTCTFREITPKKKIVYDDNFSDDKGNVVQPSYYGMPGEWGKVVVTLTFEEVNGKTKMTLHQEGIPEEMYDDCIKGWQSSLDKIEKNLK